MQSSIHRLPAIVLGAVLAITAVLPSGPAQTAAASGDKKPNLQMLSLRDWRTQNIGNRRLLRFSTIFVNAGPGHFEVRGVRNSTSNRRMNVDQIMHRWDGGTRRIDTPAIARYSGDGHDHWHVQGVVVYEIWRESNRNVTRRGAKTGFCFFDTTAWNFSLRGARRSPYYQEAWCGTQRSLSMRVGVSTGWGDRYPWSFAYQWIDITGLPSGTYRVRATVDIQDYYDERVETDNCVWTRIRIPEAGSGRQPTIVENGSDCGAEAITPVSSFEGGTVWDPPITARVTAGTYTGYKFNSQGTVLGTTQKTISGTRHFTTTARATPPGNSRKYVYLTSGQLAGYWVRRGDVDALIP